MQRKRTSEQIYYMVLDWKKRNPEKYKAQKMVFVAVRNGTLKKECCCMCGNPKSEAHHENYKKPLEVIWFCKKHHGEADARRRKRERAVENSVVLS